MTIEPVQSRSARTPILLAIGGLLLFALSAFSLLHSIDWVSDCETAAQMKVEAVCQSGDAIFRLSPIIFWIALPGCLSIGLAVMGKGLSRLFRNVPPRWSALLLFVLGALKLIGAFVHITLFLGVGHEPILS
jgi:hypothetical protein